MIAYQSHAQNILNEDHTILKVNDLSSYHNGRDYYPQSFNYHEYEEVNLEEFDKSFHIDDVKKYTFFAVLSHSGTKDIFQVHSENSLVIVTKSLMR